MGAKREDDVSLHITGTLSSAFSVRHLELNRRQGVECVLLPCEDSGSSGGVEPSDGGEARSDADCKAGRYGGEELDHKRRFDGYKTLTRIAPHNLPYVGRHLFCRRMP